MTRVIPATLKKRQDVVTDGGIADDIVANAPARRRTTSSSCPSVADVRHWAEAIA